MDTAGTAAAEPFATYLAKYWVAKKGFQPGAFPEAKPLLSEHSLVLTYWDGFAFRLVCLVDRESHPEARFALSTYDLEQIGRHSHAIRQEGQKKRPVLIHIIEVGPGVDTADDRRRLGGISFVDGPVRVSGWIVDTATGSVWTNAGFGSSVQRRFIARRLREPRLGEAELQPPAPADVGAPAVPFLTYALLAVLVAVFAAEQIFALGSVTGLLDLTPVSLAAVGGLNWNLVVKFGEWHRLLSAPFLHANLIHLVLNGIVLFFAGSRLERVIGHAWFAMTYAAGGLAGAFASLAFNAANVVSVGASGAIMGVLAATFVCGFRFPAGTAERTRMQMTALQVLIPALIPLGTGGLNVDIAAHAGGALGGTGIGLLVLRIWPRTQPWPAFRRIAAAISAAALLAAAVSLIPISSTYVEFAKVTPPAQSTSTSRR